MWIRCFTVYGNEKTELNKFQFVGMMIRARADEINRQPSKFASQKAKKRDSRNVCEKSNKKPKNQANMWSTENIRFCGKYIEKTAENKSKMARFRLFFGRSGGKASRKQLITVYDDAPEENNEYAEPQTCEGDGIRLYFRAVGEPWFESRKIKIRLS